ncbi:MAG: SDR family NAD(P)-dependent oxidoreductase [Desulfitobacteriaceae bacterium]
MERLKGKIAIVTGGSSGIGKAIAEKYCQEGAYVVIADINSEGEKVVEKINEEGGNAVFTQADVSLSPDVQRVVNQTVSHFGKVDILVNVAGKESTKSLLDTEEQEWDHILTVNLKSVYLMSKYAVEQFRKQGGGVIINMGSVTAKVGFLNYPAYSASKGAIHALTRQMAMELAKYNIRANVIFPGTIKTPLAIRNFLATNPDLEQALSESASLHPLGRLGEPEDVAYLAIYLGSDESSFVTGQEFGVDGGFTIRGC